MGRTVNPLSFDFSGSNPLLPTPYGMGSATVYQIHAGVAQLVER
jgi:hypothetical protein